MRVTTFSCCVFVVQHPEYQCCTQYLAPRERVQINYTRKDDTYNLISGINKLPLCYRIIERTCRRVITVAKNNAPKLLIV